MVAITAQNVVQVDDRNGSHYWIFRCYHVTGNNSTINVDDSCIGAAEVPPDALTAQTVTVANTDGPDSVKEITIDTGAPTAWYTIIARFGGTAGSGSGKAAL